MRMCNRLAQSRATVHTPEEEQSHDDLENAYRQYEARHYHVVLPTGSPTARSNSATRW